METTEFTLNIGVNPGYFHNNEVPVGLVSELWQKIAEEIYSDTEVFVAGIIQPSKTVYRPQWGCPIGGEDTLVITGLRNPEFQKNDALWRTSVTMVALRLSKELLQTTAYLSFAPVSFLYLRSK